jgi:hypothetical protein
VNRRRVREDWWAQADVDRAQIFVPAIMGAGLLVSAVTLVRDAVHDRRRTGRDRRTALQSVAVASFVRHGSAPDHALVAGLRPRFHYLLLALSAAALAFYGAYGGTKNYTAPPHRFGADVAWMYALLLTGAAALSVVAVVSAIVLVRYARPPAALRPLLTRTPLGQGPGSARPAVLLLGWAALLVSTGAALLTFASSRNSPLVTEIDAVARLLPDAGPALPWGVLGSAPVALGAAVVLGFLTRRCAAFALGQLAAVAIALAAHTVFSDAVERVHPPDGPLAGLTDSLPSAPVLLATLFAGLVPLAVHVRTGRRRPALVTLAVTSPLAGAAFVGSVVDRLAWPTDALSGLLAGAALALATWWAMERRRWHDRCDTCPWRDPDAPPAVRLLRLSRSRYGDRSPTRSRRSGAGERAQQQVDPHEPHHPSLGAPPQPGADADRVLVDRRHQPRP